MSNYQHTAVYKIQYATSCRTPHNPTQNVQHPTHSNTYNSVRHTLLTPFTLPHKMSNSQHIAVHTILYATSDWTPQTPTQNVQLPTKSSRFNSVRYSLLNPSHSHTKCPNTNTQQYIQISTPLPAVPSHSHTKCPTANPQQYIKFSTPLPAFPLTLPYKMSNCQQTTVHTNQYTTSSWPQSQFHKKCRTPNTQH